MAEEKKTQIQDLSDMESIIRNKVPEPRVWQIPTDPASMYEGMEDIGVGPRYFGHIRKGEYHLDIGGPKTAYTSYYFLDIIDTPDKIADGKVTVYGPDINEIPPETTVPVGMHVKFYGSKLQHEHMEYIERVWCMGVIYLEGWMASGARKDTWIRVSKEMAPKFSWAKLAQATRAYVLLTTPIVEQVETVFVVATPEMGGKELLVPLIEKCQARWDVYDAWAKDLEDSDVDIFYGCTLCQAIAPNHACVISPNAIPFCAIMSYQGAKVGYEIDPDGYLFQIPRGEPIDEDLGWYEGVDKEMFVRSHGHYKHYHLNSTISYVTTNCGCFEAATFYVPEVDGVGICARRYIGMTPLGIRFSTLAGIMSGGEQNHGFKGTSLRAMRMKTFLRGDGGWNRVVWIPKDVKKEIADVIPEELYDKIATEDDAIEPEDLKAFLREKKHPIVEKFWKGGEPKPIELPSPGEDWADEVWGEKIAKRIKVLDADRGREGKAVATRRRL